jgi:hypothetical protein
MTAREDNFTATPDAAAAYEAERAQNSATTEAHQHSFARDGDELRCFCGESVTWADVEP